MKFDLLGLEDPVRREVLAVPAWRRFDRGVVLFHEAEAGGSLYVLMRGRVAIRVTTPDGDTATLNVIGPGAAFGARVACYRLRGCNQRQGLTVAIQATARKSAHLEARAVATWARSRRTAPAGLGADEQARHDGPGGGRDDGTASGRAG